MIGERYQVLEKVAESPRSTVYRAFDSLRQRPVALRRPKVGDGRAEADALSQIHQPHVVELVGSGNDASGPWLALEWLEGETLDARVQREPLSSSEGLAFARQGLQALAAVHAAGFVHRDIKPENSMLIRAATGAFHLKLFDFELAQRVDEHTNNTSVGSVFCMAPEQFRGGPIDSRADLYALGCVLYFAVSGRYPFDGESNAQVITAHLQHRCPSLASLRPDLPEDLVILTTQLINRQREERPKSALSACNLLAGSLDDNTKS